MKTSYRFLLTLCLALLLGACTSTREGQQAADPAAQNAAMEQSMEDQLVEQSIAAMGGRETISAIQTIESEGEVELPTMGMTLPLKVYQKRPGMVRTEVEIPQMGATVISAYDGETGWTINPMQGSSPQKLPENQVQTMKDQGNMDGFLDGYKEKGYALEYLGEVEVKGAPAHKLRVVRPDLPEVIYYLDAESHLPVRQDGKSPDPTTGQMVDTESYVSDYRNINGMMMPFQIDVHANGQVVQRVTISDVTVNEDLDDTLFAFPGKSKPTE